MSNWEDTVMTPEQLTPYLSTTDLYSAMCVDYKRAFDAQAKISFEAGVDRGWKQAEAHYHIDTG